MGRLLAAVVLVAGCGRLGFKDVPEAEPDAAPQPIAQLACGAPTRFEIGASSVTAIATASDDNGFSVFAADSSGALRGLEYGFTNDELLVQNDVALGASVTGQLGATTNAGARMLASLDGMPTATGTSIYALDGSLAQTASPSVRAGTYAAEGALATSAAGTVALLTVDKATGDVDAHRLAADATDVGQPVKLVSGTEMAMNVSIAPAESGFVIAYSSGAASPTQVHLLLVDDTFAITAGPVAVDNAAFDEYRPHVVAGPGVYLIVWHAKDVSDDDDVWYSLYSPDLTQQGMPVKVATFSSDAVVGADAEGFWIAWKSYSPTTILGGAHVAVDGTSTPRPVTMSGGTPGAWAMTQRAGQAVLAWTEVGGSGPDLYLDPMCP